MSRRSPRCSLACDADSTYRDGAICSFNFEVARALGQPESVVTFEPNISGSDRKADLRVQQPGREWLVETTALFRSMSDRQATMYEDMFRMALRAIEVRHQVHCLAYLEDHLDKPATDRWLADVESAARLVSDIGGLQVVTSDAVHVVVQNLAPPVDSITFSGVARSGDGWRRLGRALRAKAHQSTGTVPVWLRVDVLDGLFQFTDWSRMPWLERVTALVQAVRHELGDVQHLAGVVVSCGPAACLGAVDPDEEAVTANCDVGTGMRRLIAPHLVRETVVLPLDATAQAQAWVNAYDGEPSWLAEDLRRFKLVIGE